MVETVETVEAGPQEHSKRQVGFVSAPVFARPDGMRRGEATFPAA